MFSKKVCVCVVGRWGEGMQHFRTGMQNSIRIVILNLVFRIAIDFLCSLYFGIVSKIYILHMK